MDTDELFFLETFLALLPYLLVCLGDRIKANRCAGAPRC